MTAWAASVWRRTPLWLRLITAVLALSTLALTVMGIFGTRLLRGYLVERVDDQLVAAASYAAQVFNEDRPGLVVSSEYRFVLQDHAGLPLGQWPERLPDTTTPDLPALSPTDAAERHGEPFTVDSAEDGGSWRAVAIPLDDGSRTIVTATQLDDVDDTVHQLTTINFIVGGVVLAGLALAGYAMVRAALRPLTNIEQTAAAIAGGDLSRRVDDHDPRTEVGQLGQALNTMLEQIETAFRAQASSESAARRSEEEMRRFVADASHELRTPLTSIRGFAELYRQGAVADPEEVSNLLVRIEDEAKRMGLLVDDLLLLARLDQQRPFDRSPVDLRVLATDAVEAARATAPDREIRLDLPADGADGYGGDGSALVVAGDEPRLRQVLGNLLDNALAYSPADTPIAVLAGRTRREGQVVGFMEVRDRGPGLTREQAERVFERFYRTDKARSRARGGTGLGLSIVAAITGAHGGTVEVDTAPGEGATFRVLLPLTGADDAPVPLPSPPAPAASVRQMGVPTPEDV
jgi:two-component system OmpR family sensor kinase